MPRYPFKFVQSDAMTFPLEGYDFIWASPPCQAHSALVHLHPEREYACHIDAMREKAQASGIPYVIENVPAAPLIKSFMLCGSSFRLKVRRHRIFEASFSALVPGCEHGLQGRPIDVSGTGGRRINRRPDDRGGNTNKPRNLAEARVAMGIDWMTRQELSQAIPPAYSEFIARQFA
jgi:DNA (cytosine-5)-methyltransferase 1